MAAFLHTLLTLSILGSVLTGLLLLARPLIKSKAVAYYLWLLVLVRLIVPMGMTISLPAQPEELVQIQTQMAAPDGGVQTTPVQSQGESGTPVAPEIAPQPQRAPVVDWKGVLTDPELWLGLWAVGAALWLGRYVWGYRRFVSLVCASARPAGQAARNVLAGLAPGRRVALLECPYVHTPMLLGAIHPAIVLPLGVEAHRLTDILAHELTHARRHDLLYKWLAAAVSSLHWFNPLMVVVRREISRACELSCDEAVTRFMDGPARKHYAETLLTLAARPPRGMGVLATTLCEKKEQMKERLVLIMMGKKQGPAALAVTVLLSVALMGCAVVNGAAAAGTGNLVERFQTTDQVQGWTLELDREQMAQLSHLLNGAASDLSLEPEESWLGYVFAPKADGSGQGGVTVGGSIFPEEANYVAFGVEGNLPSSLPGVHVALYDADGNSVIWKAGLSSYQMVVFELPEAEQSYTLRISGAGAENGADFWYFTHETCPVDYFLKR
ncbi:M56 family metallopeptidase [Flavonifractor porci]|uniref:M56 family metallopeptidase n=1 Tax=Flavonifractor porci TaxID=3133422 RepID=UPI0030A141E1